MSNPLTGCKFFQNGDASFLARIEFDGVVADKADIASITCNVYDLNSATPTVPILTPTVSVASCMHDALQLDGRWNADLLGYNFLHDMPATAFPTGAHNYDVIYKFTSSTGKIAPVIFKGNAELTDY